jgi:hypothetical protein
MITYGYDPNPILRIFLSYASRPSRYYLEKPAISNWARKLTEGLVPKEESALVSGILEEIEKRKNKT